MCRCLQKYRILQPILDIYTYNIKLYVFCKFSYNKILLFVNIFVTLHYHLSWDVPNDDNEKKDMRMRKKMIWMLVAILLCGSIGFVAYTINKVQTTEETVARLPFIPKAPDYADSTMWITVDDSIVCHYADVWNPEHREHMANEMRRAAAYMSPGNRFFAPYYRHTTMDAWVTQDEDTIWQRTRLAMEDVCKAFDCFLAQHDRTRPIIIAGFSQGGMGVVELLKHISDETYSQLAAAYVLGYKVTEADMNVTICYNTVKDVKYTKSIIAGSAICINPVNWCTDDTPATLHDTITIAVSPEHHVLVATGYSASEYAPYRDLINVGDIHSCEPWLYSECLQRNMAVRAGEWRKVKGKG